MMPFGTAHRAHASTAGMVALVPRVAAGDLLRAELEHLRVVLEPIRPLVCLLGGAKVSDKIAVLEALAERADVLAIGGAMAYTFLRAEGEPTGNSRVEEDHVADARRVLQAAAAAGRRILLPVDHVVAEKLEADAVSRVAKQIPEGWLGVDIGPETAAIYAAEVRKAGTIFWNGPMGVFEIESLRQRHRSGGPGDRGVEGRLRRRRRRLARGRQQAWPRLADHAPLDGRRRFARVRPGTHAPGCRGAGALGAAPDSRGKLEDVQDGRWRHWPSSRSSCPTRREWTRSKSCSPLHSRRLSRWRVPSRARR